MEIEWNQNGKFVGEKVGGIFGENGMEIFLTNQVEINFDGVESKWGWSFQKKMN